MNTHFHFDVLVAMESHPWENKRNGTVWYLRPIFLAAILFVLGITVFTVTYHAFKAAIINPSETLRYE